MKIFISIVSHWHHDIIINLGTIKKLRKFNEVYVVCRDNKPVNKLKQYCEKYDATYIPNETEMGFSANNNHNFLYCQEHLGMSGSDLFILMNPDVYICDDEITHFISTLQTTSPKLATCNLYLDKEYMVHDDNIRQYPKFINFIKTYLLNDRTTMVNRNNGLNVTDMHWASGSFLIVKPSLYTQLNGLDENYYMYCEDIDFCRRASMIGEVFTYFESIKAVHYRRRFSKRFLSKYFFWHVASVFRYSFSKKSIKAKKSCLVNNDD